MFCFFNRQGLAASRRSPKKCMSNLGVPNRIFWGCQEQIDYLLPRWESWTLGAEAARCDKAAENPPFFINEESSDSQSHHISWMKIPFPFPFTPKKLKGLGEISWVFPELVRKLFFLGNFKISKFQNITCWVAYFWAVATTPRAPYRVPRRKLMFERPVDLKEAAESGRCVEDELDFQEEKTDFVIKVLICK